MQANSRRRVVNEEHDNPVHDEADAEADDIPAGPLNDEVYFFFCTNLDEISIKCVALNLRKKHSSFRS